MMLTPEISVILPVYNGGKYLAEAIDSILRQSFQNFELIVINDGSEDDSLLVIQKFMEDDRRIILIDRENKGLVASLNEGIARSRGKYIARMDADDVCMHDRFEKQLKYFSDNPSVSVLGTRAIVIDEAGREIGIRNVARGNYMIKSILFFGSPMLHPSVMFRKETIGKELYYSDEFIHAEDYELWARLSQYNEMKFGNFPKPLIYYRIVNSSVSRKYRDEQLHAARRVSDRYILRNGLSYFDRSATESKLDIFRRLFLQRKYVFLPFQLVYFARCFFK